MNKIFLTLSITSLVLLSACEIEQPIDLKSTAHDDTKGNQVVQKEPEVVPDEYIVLFKEDIEVFNRLDAATLEEELRQTRATRASQASTREYRKEIIRDYGEKMAAKHQGGRVKEVFDMGRTKGMVIYASRTQASDITSDPNVAAVEPNHLIALDIEAQIKNRLVPADNGMPTQHTSYGTKRVGDFTDMTGDVNWIFIVDSGIDLDHPDLNIQQAYCRNFVAGKSDANDEFGHGTHVAGIVGAKNNGQGTVGVAAGASLVSYRVLDENGDGDNSNLLMALYDLYWTTIPGDVVNLSLGTNKSRIIRAAVKAAQLRTGVYFTIAAGNASTNTSNYSPSDMQEGNIFIVGATNYFNFPAWYSNYGTNIEYVAPGSAIYSTYKDGKYCWLSGTSMAAPHIAGLLLAGDGTINHSRTVRLPSGNYAKLANK